MFDSNCKKHGVQWVEFSSGCLIFAVMFGIDLAKGAGPNTNKLKPKLATQTSKPPPTIVETVIRAVLKPVIVRALDTEILAKDPIWLKWQDPEELDAKTSARKHPWSGTVTLKGQYVSLDRYKGWTLFAGKTILAKVPGPFTHTASWVGEKSRISISVVSPTGKVETAVYELSVDLAQTKEAHIERPPSRFQAIPSVGLTYLSYAQSHYASFSQISTSIKVGFGLSIIRNWWDLGATAFYNVFPIYTSHPDRATIQFLGANIRTGTSIPWIRQPWQAGISAGVGFSKTFVRRSDFGFSGLTYFEIYPSMRRTLKKGGAFGAYLKYVPFSPKHVFSLAHSELGIGASLYLDVGIRFPWGLSLDLNSLGITVGDAAMRAVSLSVSTGLKF